MKRPNRFTAHVMVDGKEEIAHVKNTGRCRELLVPGTVVYLQVHDISSRKTKYSLVTVKKGGLLINIDSQAPNKVMQEYLAQTKGLPGLNNLISRIKPEAAYGSSRFDFQVSAGAQQAFLEIKGVTLEQDGIAKFPDAPTERGVKHIRELMEAAGKGFLAYVIFVVQMKGIKYVTPNDRTHREFGLALREAYRAGVNILAYDCCVKPDELSIDQPVPVVLQEFDIFS